MAIKDILKTHRTWEDGVGLALGLMIGLSPWFYDEPVVPAVLLNSGLIGLAVLALAQLELVRLRRWEELAQGAAIWSFLAPSRSWSHMLSKSLCASRRNREFFFRDGTKYRPDHPEASCMKCSRCSKSIALK